MAEKEPSDKKPSKETPEETPGSGSPAPLGEIEQGPSKLDQFLEKNQKVLLLAVSVIVIAVSIWIVVKELRNSKRTNAGEALVAAKNVADLKMVISDYGDTPAAGSAQVLLAKQEWQDGEKELAISTLEKFISDQPDHPARGSARMTLANYHYENGDTEACAETLDQVVKDESSSYLAPIALLRLGDLEKEDDRNAEARAYYEKAQAHLEEKSPFGRIRARTAPTIQSYINERLALVDLALPTVLEKEDPPEPPEPPVDPLERIDPPFLPDWAPDNTETTAPGIPEKPGGITPGPGGITPGPGGITPGPGGITPGPGGITPGPGETTPGPGETTPGPGETTPGPGETTPGPGETTPGPGENTPKPGEENTPPDPPTPTDP